MHNRVLMARFSPAAKLIPEADDICPCGNSLLDGETVFLYPNPDYEDIRLRDAVCMTCHFWFIHEVQTELER